MQNAMHEVIVCDVELAPPVRDAVERLVIDSREDVSTGSATLMTLIRVNEKLMSQLVASQ